jgi:chromosome segregation ATPase
MAELTERVDRLEGAIMELVYIQHKTEMGIQSLKREIKEFKDAIQKDTENLKRELTEFKDEMKTFRDRIEKFEDYEMWK